MIEGLGYTEDGKVWMAFAIIVNEQRGRAVLNLTPEEAKRAAENLIEAAEKAQKFLPIEVEAKNVRNSKHTH